MMYSKLVLWYNGLDESKMQSHFNIPYIRLEDSIMSDSSTSLPVDQRLELSEITRSEFINAMIHLYRGELGEATAWRGRIDTTSHWAIVLSATALSFVFSDKAIERHVLIPIISLFCTFLLAMEAR